MAKKYHSIKMEDERVWLDGFLIKCVMSKDLRLKHMANGVYQPVISLEIALDPQSKTTIDSLGDDVCGDLGQHVNSE